MLKHFMTVKFYQSPRFRHFRVFFLIRPFAIESFGLRGQFKQLVSPRRIKGGPFFLLAGCLWLMEILGLSSKNATISHFYLSIQTRITRFCQNILTHIFKGRSMGMITQFFQQIMFASYKQHQILDRKKGLIYLMKLQHF